jgi:RNA polymerase sigma-70 factor (ECF subfamily)
VSTAGPPVPAAGEYAGIFREHQRFLWSLCYRLTGCAADADDLVQETFVRAMERPPRRRDAPWRPWLVRVAVNLGRDLLRRRRVRGAYPGPWLPSPIETGEEESPPAVEVELAGAGSTEGRYDMLESVTFAFLLALEALTPAQRAVLLLRDVFDYSVSEAAEALGMTEANVKTTHHRARRAMRAYDGAPCRPTRALREETRCALERLVACLATGDAAGMEALLTEDVLALSDGAGEFLAARVPVVGRARVARFYTGIATRRAAERTEVRMLNGLPALVVEFAAGLPREARRIVLHVGLAADGRIRAIHTVLATRKLTAVGAEPSFP